MRTVAQTEFTTAVVVPADMKLCTKCGEIKLRAEFNVNKRKADKLRNDCRQCTIFHDRQRELKRIAAKHCKLVKCRYPLISRQFCVFHYAKNALRANTPENRAKQRKAKTRRGYNKNASKRNKKAIIRQFRYNLVAIDSKVCFICGMTKHKLDFRLDRQGASGLYAYCRDCQDNRSKQRNLRRRAAGLCYGCPRSAIFGTRCFYHWIKDRYVHRFKWRTGT
jgi:hypothetical protein